MPDNKRVKLNKNAKVIITGGLGHIGSALANELASHNQVTVIDNEIYYACQSLPSSVNVLKGDVADLIQSVDRADYIFHFGEYARVEQSKSEAAFVLKNNFSATLPVLEAAKRNKSKLIYSGSSTKFSDSGSAWKKTPYGLSKYINSEMVKGYCEWCDVDHAILYFNNVYGGAERATGKYATVIAKFIKLARQGESVAVTAPGDQRRSFTHLDDVIKAILLVANHGFGDDYVISPDKDYSILDIAKCVGAEIRIVESDDANRRGGLLDNSKVKALGWSPQIDLEQYIKEQLKGHCQTRGA